MSQATATLRAMFGSDPTEIPAAASQSWVTRWQEDPWSLGSYSYIRAGATGTERTVLAQPVSKLLYFAGEAANKKYASTVQVRFCNGVVQESEQATECFWNCRVPPLPSKCTRRLCAEVQSACLRTHDARAAHSRMCALAHSLTRRAHG